MTVGKRLNAPDMPTAEGDRARPTRGELLETFCETATEVVERDFHTVSEPTPIAQLAIDSLGMLEIIGSLERRFDIRLPDEALAGVETIQDLLDEVEKRLA